MGVEIDQSEDPALDVGWQVQKLLGVGGEFLARGVCLEVRGSQGWEICALLTLKELHEAVHDSERAVMV